MDYRRRLIAGVSLLLVSATGCRTTPGGATTDAPVIADASPQVDSPATFPSNGDVDSDVEPDLTDATDRPPETDVSVSDMRPDIDFFCHYDCFGYVSCRDGVVAAGIHAPIPCREWTGSCPVREVGTCRRGCAMARIDRYLSCPLDICTENSPKTPGAACTSDPDCLPTRISRDADGGINQTYLRCDPQSRTCVMTEPPTVPDWLGPCDPNVLGNANRNAAYPAIADPSCSGGICMYSFPEGRACIEQGCTRPCTDDHQCPRGSRCRTDGFTCERTRPGYCAIDLRLPCR